MAKLIVEEQKEYSVLPVDSILHLKVDEISTRTVNGRNGDWEKLEFKFKVLGIQAIGDGSDPADYEDVIGGPIWGSVPMRLTTNPENKLRLWSEAIFGMELGAGFELDTDNFLNREVRGLTGQYDKRSTDSQGRPFKGHQIDSLLPKGDGGFQSAQPQQDPWAVPGQQQAQPNDPWASQQQAQPQYQQPDPSYAQQQTQQYTQPQYQQPQQQTWPQGDEPPF